MKKSLSTITTCLKEPRISPLHPFLGGTQSVISNIPWRPFEGLFLLRDDFGLLAFSSSCINLRLLIRFLAKYFSTDESVSNVLMFLNILIHFLLETPCSRHLFLLICWLGVSPISHCHLLNI